MWGRGEGGRAGGVFYPERLMGWEMGDGRDRELNSQPTRVESVTS